LADREKEMKKQQASFIRGIIAGGLFSMFGSFWVLCYSECVKDSPPNWLLLFIISSLGFIVLLVYLWSQVKKLLT
jgi:hypothetical protein